MKKFIVLFCMLSTFVLGQNKESKVDYRSYQSPVKNQGERGTCTAFSIASILETLPNSYKDVSERYIYAAMKTVDFTYKDFFSGAILSEYVVTLPKYGILEEKELPYHDKFEYKIEKDDINLRKVILEADIGPVDLLVNYVPKAQKYVPNYAIKTYPKDSIRNPEFIKRLLKKHKSIPVSYHIYAGGWKKGTVSTSKPISIKNCGYQIVSNKDGKIYPATSGKTMYGEKFFTDIFNKNAEFLLVRSDQEKNHYGGHAVNIVGYDGDNFIIKNSWGTDWGTDGYVYMSFDYHKIFVTDLITIEKILDK